MTQRERVLTQVLLTAVLLIGGGMGCHVFVWQPLSEVHGRLLEARNELIQTQTDLSVQQREIDSLLRLRPRLAQWQMTSLPPRDPEDRKKKSKRGLGPEEIKKRHVSSLQTDYERFLWELLRRNGFSADSIKIGTRQSDIKAVPKLPNKAPLYEPLTFTVAGRARLDGVVQMLADFHRTPLLHSVHNLSLSLPDQQRLAASRPGPGPRGPMRGGSGGRELNVTMTVEALIVNGAKDRSALLPTLAAGTAQPRVLAEPARRYADMNLKNMFTGTPGAADLARGRENQRDVLRFVKLTHLAHNGRRWEAYLYDQAKGGAEKRVNSVTVTEFTVRDRYNNAVLEGEVVYIDELQVVFRSDGKFYRLRLGDFLYPAIRTPLSTTELKDLKLAATTASR
jgi:hypothetical protein